MITMELRHVYRCGNKGIVAVITLLLMNSFMRKENGLMKRIGLLLACLIGIGYCKASGYVVMGSDSSFVDGQYVYLLDGVKWNVLDSARIENASFRLEGSDKGTGICFPYMGKSSNPQELTQIGSQVFLEDDACIVLQSDSMFGCISTGSPMNDAYWTLMKSRAGKSLEQVKTLTKEVLLQHPDVLGCYLLEDLMIMASKQEIESLMGTFPSELHKHPLYARAKAMLAETKADLSMPYLDVSGKDRSGQSIALSGTVNKKGVKYVLLEFWATWCGPCRREIPNLKHLYAAYREEGFEIYGLSFDKDAKSWKEVLEKEALPWTNVITEVKDNPRNTPVWKAYGLNGIPWNYLIDAASGQIIGKCLTGEYLSDKLAELMR